MTQIVENEVFDAKHFLSFSCNQTGFMCFELNFGFPPLEILNPADLRLQKLKRGLFQMSRLKELKIY